MQDKKYPWLSNVLMFTPVIICILAMLPRLRSAQFGLLDDGTTIATAQQIAAGKWGPANEIGAGRFRPAYWLYYGLVYRIAGPDARAFFIGNLVLFAAVTAGLVWLVHLGGGSRLAAGLAGFFFAASGAAVESFYTLSKPEVVQVLGMTLLLISVSAFAGTSSKTAKPFLILLALLAMALVMSEKETGLALAPISLAWLGISWLAERRKDIKPERNSRLVMVGVVLAVSAAYLLLRAHYVALGLSAGGYSGNYSVSVPRFLSSGLHWAGWLARDYLFLLPLGLFLIVLWIKKGAVLSGRRYLEWLVWMGVWIAVYLPWVYSLEYYLLPFALGCAAFSGLAVVDAVGLLPQSNRAERISLVACLASILLLLAATIPNNSTNARLQLAVDAANAEMLDHLASNLPQNTLLLVALPPGYEYYHEVELHMEYLYHRPDIVIQRFPFKSVDEERRAPLPYTIITPQIKNPPPLSVRLGVNEEVSALAGTAIRQLLGPDAAPETKIERSYRLFTIDFLRIGCPFFKTRGYCAATTAILDRSWLSYGWSIYTVTSHPLAWGAQ